MFTDISRFILCFTLYSFLGWGCECIWCSIPARKFINRGFLIGPVCPIYGFGGMLVVALLKPVSGSSILLLFICAAVLTTLLEYITSVLMEQIFHMRWWDYSDKKFNLSGRVCLLNTIMFGIMGVALMYIIHPFIFELTSALPDILAIISAIFILVLFIADLYVSVLSTLQLDDKLSQLHDTVNELKEKGKEHGDAIRARLKELSRTKLLHRRVMSAFPGLKSKRYNAALERLREAIENKKNK